MHREIHSILKLFFISGLVLSTQPLADQPGTSPIKVFLMAGQSNMEGQGVVDLNDPSSFNGGKGNLEYVMANSPLKARYTGLKDNAGKWKVWNDVWARYRTSPTVLLKGDLSVGYSVYGDVHHFGTELQFGHILSDSLENQVLLIKAAWGGRDIAVDFRPPSSGGTVGPFYTTMIQYFKEGLANIAADFPGYDGKGYEIVGFVWFHGFNDALDAGKIAAYEVNCANLIKDVRKEFNVPKLPVVIGEENGVGAAAMSASALAMQKAQQAVADRPEFAGQITYVKTASYVRPGAESPNVSHGHHFYGNAETFFLIGDAFGKEMLKLLPKTTKAKGVSPNSLSQAAQMHLALNLGAGRGIQTLDIDLPRNGLVAITILDMAGRAIYKKAAASSAAVERIDMPNLNRGIYQVRVQWPKVSVSKALAVF